MYGLKGRVFSVVETVERVSEKHGLAKDANTVAILGVGEIGEAIIRNLEEKGYRAVGIDIQIQGWTGGVVQRGAEEAETGRPGCCPDAPRRRCRALLRGPEENGDPGGRCPSPDHRQAGRGEILQGRHRPQPASSSSPLFPGTRSTGSPAASRNHWSLQNPDKSDMPQEEFNRRSKELGFFAHMVDDR